MSEAENIERVVNSLKTVPPKSLLIIELANRLPWKDGEMDYDAMADIQLEVNLAIAEAKMYGGHTILAVQTLSRLTAGEEDV